MFVVPRSCMHDSADHNGSQEKGTYKGVTKDLWSMVSASRRSHDCQPALAVINCQVT